MRMVMGKSITLLLVTVCLIACIIVIPPAKASPKTIVVPDNYATIQDAIDNASAGDTIFVRSGTYNQNLTIGKPLSLIGQDAQTTTLTMPKIYSIILGAPVGPPTTYVVSINANNVNISGFTVTNPNPDGAGIYSDGDANQITKIIMNQNSQGVYGVFINGYNQYIAQNYLVDGFECSGMYNQIINNSYIDTIILTGSHNSITGNALGSVTLSDSQTSIVYNNTLNGTVSLMHSDQNIVYNNSMKGLDVGMVNSLYEMHTSGEASSNLIQKNVIEDANPYAWAILVGYGSNNVFFGNFVANNGGYGLAVGGIDIEVDNNLFYCNNFMNNTKNFGTNWQVIGSNSFDNGTTGNYWDDYLTKYPNATEVDDSGIGNTPYLVYGNVTDDYPLLNTFDTANANIQLPTWIGSLPTLLPLPSFPSSSPSPSVPEFPVWIILPLFMIATLIAVVYFRKRKH
jgi:nitrous oxidase accessory protein